MANNSEEAWSATPQRVGQLFTPGAMALEMVAAYAKTGEDSKLKGCTFRHIVEYLKYGETSDNLNVAKGDLNVAEGDFWVTHSELAAARIARVNPQDFARNMLDTRREAWGLNDDSEGLRLHLT